MADKPGGGCLQPIQAGYTAAACGRPAGGPYKASGESPAAVVPSDTRPKRPPIMRLFSAFCGGMALNGNVKHFVFDLTCDVTGDPEVKFVQLHLKDHVQVSSLPFEIFRHVYCLPR